MIRSLIKLTLTPLFILFFSTTHAQIDQIRIGQSAVKVHTLVLGEVENHNKNYGPKDHSRMSADMKSSNRDITEVILYYKKSVESAADSNLNYCQRYFMADGSLSFKQKEYEQVTAAQLVSMYDRSNIYRKVGRCYFTNDYKYYTRIFAAPNGHAIAEYRKTMTANLTADELKLLQKQLPAIKAAEQEVYDESMEESDSDNDGIRLSTRIEIGQSAAQIQSLISFTTKEYNKISIYRNEASYCKSDVQYQYGKIAAVTQCYQNAYLADFQQLTNYCKQYRMVNNRLADIVTQYGNMSLGQLKWHYQRTSFDDIIGDLYFTDDYEHYTKIYLSDGLPTTVYRKTILSELPANIRTTVSTRLTTMRTQIRKREMAAYIKSFKAEDAGRKIREKILLGCKPFSEGLAAVAIASAKDRPDYRDYLWGYLNENGDYAIRPQFAYTTSFHDGIAFVIRYGDKNKYECINKAGEIIFDTTFYKFRPFSEGIAVVGDGYYYTFIDKTGKRITAETYQEVGDFKGGLARVQKHGLWGYIDKTGKEVIPPQFDRAMDFEDGIAIAYQQDHDSFIYLDKTGAIVKTVQASKGGYQDYGINGKMIPFRFVNNFSIVKEGGRYGFIRSFRKYLIGPIFDSVANFSEGLARVKRNGYWGFLDTTGHMVLNKGIMKQNQLASDSAFQSVTDFSEGFSVVRVNAMYGYLAKDGKWLIPPVLEEALPFSDGKALILNTKERKGWNFIDKTGKIVYEDFM